MKYSQIITGLVPLCAAALSFAACSAEEPGTGGTSGAPAAGQGGNGGAAGSVSSGGSAGTSTTGGAGGTTGGAGAGGTTGGAGGGGSGGAAGAATGGAGASGATGGAGAGGAGTGGAGAGGASGGVGGASAGGGSGTGGAGAGGVAGGGSGTGGVSGTGGGTAGASGSGTCDGTAEPCPPTSERSIAYIGCSMAQNIGNGYRAVDGRIMWNSDGYQTGAQVVPNWVEGGSAWGGFDNKLNSMGGKDSVKAIMVQICIIQVATDEQIKSMIRAARAKINPDAHIYLVGQPQYENGHTCAIAGGQEATTDEQARRLGADESIDPNLSFLGTFMLNCDDGECSDSCHASPKGEERLGNQAKEFWGG
jgi:hypothetical protein